MEEGRPLSYQASAVLIDERNIRIPAALKIVELGHGDLLVLIDFIFKIRGKSSWSLFGKGLK